jgi:hypothetical protein
MGSAGDCAMISHQWKHAPRRKIRIVKPFAWWKLGCIRAVTYPVADVLISMGVAVYES